MLESVAAINAKEHSSLLDLCSNIDPCVDCFGCKARQDRGKCLVSEVI